MNAPASAIFIRDVTALPMAGPREVLEHVDLLIQGPEIAALAPTNRLHPPPDATVLDGRGKLALPGLVNAHNHAGLSLMRGTSEAMPLEAWLSWLIPQQQMMSPEDIACSASLACLEQIRHGITTFADMLGLEEHAAPVIAASGLRAVLSKSVMEPDPDGDPGIGLEREASALAFALEWNGKADGRITARLAPHSVYTVRPALLHAIATAAREHGLGLQVHCAESWAEVEGCLARHGQTPPALLAANGYLDVPVLLAHAVHLSDADIALLDRPNVGLSHNPGSNLKLQSDRARLPDLVGRRLAVGLGTDSAASNDTLDLFKELYLAAVIHPWKPAEAPSWRALELATREGARALGLDHLIGSLEPGKRADLILVDLSDPRHAAGLDPAHQLAYAARGSDVLTTIVDGRILMHDRVVKTLDAAAILRESRDRATRLLNR
jgi:5-methylthioadenosine/S-adenosylhomocysteine deaminase